MTQTKRIIYNFDVNRDVALDARQNPVEDLNSLPPLQVRYNGLIIHVKSEDEPYIFLNDLTTPIPLRGLVSGNVLSLNTTNYRNLNTILDSVVTTVGSFLTVYPLGVTFIRTVNEWKHFSGSYNMSSTTEFENLPTNLKSVNRRVKIDNKEYVINSGLTLSDLIISTNSTPTNLESERYYLVSDVLHYSIGNKLWKLGGSSIVLTNHVLNIGMNEVNHRLNSTSIDVKIWININNQLTPIHSVNFTVTDSSNILISSYLNITDVTLIINTI